jgi:isoquinoline 1-oxidoreductase beta subunit
VPSKGVRDKVHGTQVFGFDVTVPGMLVATLIQCPVFGGRLRSLDDRGARKVRGITKIVAFENWVAVVARDTWAAVQGREKLEVDWDPGPNRSTSSEQIGKSLSAALVSGGEIVAQHGNIDAVWHDGIRQVEAIYRTSYQAHATMEPMCCTADVRASGCEIWAPTQQPTGARKAVAELLDLDESAVTVNTTLLGGGFGRRNKQDFVEQAVRISQAVEAPVKLIWTREEDIQHDFYHPATTHKLRAYLDEDGLPLGWEHRIGGVPYAAGAKRLPYAIPHQRVQTHPIDTAVPIGPWRSVAHHFNAFAVEGFVNELAATVGADPVEYRLALLKDSPRHRGVLEMAAERAGWGRSLPTNHGLGVAVHASFGSYVAEVAEIEIGKDGRIRVPRVVCAVDCGQVIHPRTAEAQVEGSIAFALAAALKSRISIRHGRVEQSNFDDFPITGMTDMPQVEVHFIESREAPGGLGEPAVPPLAPAIANAVSAAISRPVRRIPVVI